MVLGQRRATVETTRRETQEENDKFRRRILGLEQQLKEARGLAEGGEAVEARLRDKVHRLEVTLLSTLGSPRSLSCPPPFSVVCPHALPPLGTQLRTPPCAVLPSRYVAISFTANVHCPFPSPYVSIKLRFVF